MKLKLQLLKLLFSGLLFSVSFSINAQYVGLPFSGTAVQIGAVADTGYKVEMEDFDKTSGSVDGVNEVFTGSGTPAGTGTYYDKSAGNSGPVRTTGDVDTSAAGSGHVISGGQGSEYTLYTIQIMEDGDYSLTFSYKHSASGGKLHQFFLRNATTLVNELTMFNGSLPVSSYGGEVIASGLSLTAGTYVLQSRIVNNGPSYDYVEFKRVVNPDATGGAYNGPHTVDIAGELLVEAEDFDIGSNANGGSSPYGYYDAQVVDNDPLVYRATQKVIQDDGGVISLADCRPGEYTYYTLTIPSGHGGTYSAKVKYKSGGAGKTIQMHLMSDDLIEGDLMFDEVGGATSGYESLVGDETFTLSEGTQVVRLKANNAAPAIDSFSIAVPAIIGTDDIESVDNSVTAYPNPSDSGVFNLSQSSEWEIFSLIGIKVLEGNGSTIDAGNLAKGSYILKIGNTSQIIVIN